MIKVNKGEISKAIRDARYYYNMGVEVKSVFACINNQRLEYTVVTEQAEPATNEVLDLTDLINEYLYKGTLNLAKTTTKAYEMVQAFVSAKEGEQC